jgi:hypothetical protein
LFKIILFGNEENAPAFKMMLPHLDKKDLILSSGIAWPIPTFFTQPRE